MEEFAAENWDSTVQTHTSPGLHTCSLGSIIFHFVLHFTTVNLV